MMRQDHPPVAAVRGLGSSSGVPAPNACTETAQLVDDRPAGPTPLGQESFGCLLPVKPGLCRYVRTCVLGSRHGGEAPRLVEPVLPRAMQQRARMGTGQDHCELDAV